MALDLGGLLAGEGVDEPDEEKTRAKPDEQTDVKTQLRGSEPGVGFTRGCGFYSEAQRVLRKNVYSTAQQRLSAKVSGPTVRDGDSRVV